MPELPELTPEHFEILVVRELRKLGLEVPATRVHRRTTLPAPDPGYLLELQTIVTRAAWQRPALIACRRQAAPIGRVAVESLKDHVGEAGVQVGLLFATAPFEPEALQAARVGGVALFRVSDGREAFDTSGWGTPGHYPAWLPAYCAQAVDCNPLGQVRYQLLEAGQGDVILKQLEAASATESTAHRRAGGAPAGDA